MNPTLEAFVRSWPSEPWLVVALALTAAIYARGWRFLHRRDPARWHRGRLAAFMGGLLSIFLALASPIEPFAALLLQVHMVQHLLLLMMAPPLLWLGAPLFPLLRGLPEPVRRYWATPLLRSTMLERAFRRLTHPAVAWPLFVGATWLWHVPAGYELALRNRDWHLAEHACFTLTAMLFWYPVVRPYPCRPRWSPWILFPYLILADVQNTVLSAWLAFADHPLYPYYAEVPRLASLSALDDQAVAGVLMWVPGSIMYLMPLFSIGIGMLRGPTTAACRRRSALARRRVAPRTTPATVTTAKLAVLTIISLSPPVRPMVGSPRPAEPPGGEPWDLLGVPLVGRFLRWRSARPVMQMALAALAAIVIFDGLRGPRAGPMNLAGVLPWIHWRGLVVFGLLAVGNVFCMACPFTLPRTAARRWLPGGRSWPRMLRHKWLAVVLMVLFLWSYEAFALWDSPWWTAWIAIGYFVAAFVVDSLFQGAAFCKYICPIGQFNFVQSLVSPLEVKVRQADTCASCRTKECIRGKGTIPGCEMKLFQPRKSGNMDCTFCLDCIHACPHANVGLLAVVPGRTLWTASFRSGLGWFNRRRDLAALALVLVFGSFANAGGMVGPVVAWQEALRSRLGQPPWPLIVGIYYFAAVVALPLVAVGVAAAWARWWGQLSASWLDLATRFSFALVPLGFAMWLSHYSFHFLTSYATVIPTTQRFAGELGLGMFGEPEWQRACCTSVAGWIPHFEIVVLDLGMLLSLYVAFRLSEAQASRPSQAVRAFAPWGLLVVMLFAVGVWIVLEPMQMRGTLGMGG